MPKDTNAEDLHDVGKGTKSPTTPAFVNPGTPAGFVKLEDLTDPEISKSATEKIRSGLIKDRK